MEQVLYVEDERVAVRERPTVVPAEPSDQWGESAGSTAEENSVSEAELEIEPQNGVWEDRNYCWLVLCKNCWFHWRQNWFYRYRIVLGETDAVSSPPALKGPFRARCDSCGREYLYKPSELLRYEAELPNSFRPHPLFHW